MTPLPLSFYQDHDVVRLAQDLLGKSIFTDFPGEGLAGGMIIETEAYRGPEDKACHAYNMRRTPRTEVMFHQGGVAYVYLCYGMHSLLNVVTGPEDTPHAILIRALHPTHGINLMEKRRKGKLPLTGGPGTLCQALGITTKLNGTTFSEPPLWIEDRNIPVHPEQIIAGPRIGIDYAQEHAHLPWRFQLMIG